MALGPVVAAALTDHSARTRALWVGGVDVISQPGTAANRYATLIDSILVTENGPGQVSSMQFQVDDPGKALTFTEGMEVIFQDLVRDTPIFRGWLANAEAVMTGLGRVWILDVDGPEILLDWMKVSALSFAAGAADFQAAVLSVVAQAAQPGGGIALRAFGDPTGLGDSTQATPVGLAPYGTLVPVDVPSGTLRQALEALSSAYVSSGSPRHRVAATVDFYLGLRMAEITQADATWSGNVLDWADLIVGQTGTYVTASLRHAESYGETLHQVLILGGNAAGSGLVSDGSGLPGDVAFVQDATSTSATIRDGIAQNLLAARGVKVRGSFDLEDTPNIGAPGSEIHPMMRAEITNTAIPGLLSTRYPIMQIRKRFRPSTELWTVSYGGHPPSAAKTLRRLTRGTLS